ncbi:Hypothetical predicted protein [Pelobates cultripes]|uniref:Uncharacterized protein n=1 Tax=Pelobates cultripes TaxID=61616 RepID=A0AAD1W4P3_PELCU|nr:Hypothetical predicted protein [Pelobates cultripes]
MRKRRDFKVKGIQNGSQVGNVRLKLTKDSMPPCKESRVSITAGDFKPSPPKEPSRRTAPDPKFHKVKMLEQPPPRNASLLKAFKLVSSDEGRQKIEGLNIIQNLSVTKPQLLNANLKDIKEAVNKEVSGIRLDVSVAAINCMESLFCQLKSSTLDDQDECLLGLLHRVKDASHANDASHTKQHSIKQLVVNSIDEEVVSESLSSCKQISGGASASLQILNTDSIIQEKTGETGYTDGSLTKLLSCCDNCECFVVIIRDINHTDIM